MRCAALLLLAALASAKETDGAVAAPARWPGPHGPASHSRNSRAMPVVRDVVEAWATELPGPAAAPLVHWDGKAYVLCKTKRYPVLCAVALANGRIVGKKGLPKAPYGDIHVWGDQVYLRTKKTQISSLRNVGSTFVETWTYKTRPPRERFRYLGKPPERLEFKPQGMVVHDGEIYVVSYPWLLRLARGSSIPVWKFGWYCVGTPAVRGSKVFVTSHNESRRNRDIHVFALDRATGEKAGWESSSDGAMGAPETYRSKASISVSAHGLVVRTPALVGRATHAFYSLHEFGLDRVPGGFKFDVAPAVLQTAHLVCVDRAEWRWWHPKEHVVFAKKAYTPDLFHNIVPPTVLGDVVYFGSWAADVKTGEILWRLPPHPIAFGAVPADRLVLVLDGRGVLRAYKERVAG